MSLLKMITHKNHPNDAAREWLTEGVVSLGWHQSGDIANLTKNEILIKLIESGTVTKPSIGTSRLITFRDKISIGDVVIAYQKNNSIADIGEIIGEYQFVENNSLGNPFGKYLHPHQRKVRWWNIGPFDRRIISSDFSDWICTPNAISFKRYLDSSDLKRELQNNRLIE